MSIRNTLLAVLSPLAIIANPAVGEQSADHSTTREAIADAWWTGPILAATAGTLPQGHVLFEPYLFDAIQIGRFDSHGTWRNTARQDYFGSQSYVNYGATDRITIGMIPRLGYQQSSGGQSGASPEAADLTLQVQYRLNQPEPTSWIPTTSLNIQETLPTGRYDRLSRTGDGLGAGAYATSLAVYTQSYFWMPDGRILRARLDLTYTLSGRADLKDESVYGTSNGFRGHADPGDSVLADLAFEYSATQNWVLALDIAYQRQANTTLIGSYGTADVMSDSGQSGLLYLAPGVEYNFSDRIGIIAGARITAAGHNAGASVTPVAAVNCVF